MKMLLNLIILFFSSATTFGQINWRDTTNRYPDTCILLQKRASQKILPGTNHSRPLVVADGMIIRGDEIKEKLVDTIFVIKCPQSFERFGNIGALGVIYLETKQEFDTVSITRVATIRQSHGVAQKTIYAINGYLFADTTLKLSKKAVKKVEVFKNFSADFLDINEHVTCVSIWTLTNKEIKDDNSVPKPCRGVGFANAQ